jgi:exopolyphosphatase/guanosine-5'-triphosphate,3'-diphosphate pyrophosphatase
MAISHKHFHRHGAYLLRNSDLPGFSQSEQEHLATLAAGQRGKMPPDTLFEDWPTTSCHRMQRLVALLRLATLFKYVEQLEQLPDFTIERHGQNPAPGVSPDWLASIR